MPQSSSLRGDLAAIAGSPFDAAQCSASQTISKEEAEDSWWGGCNEEAWRRRDAAAGGGCGSGGE